MMTTPEKPALTHVKVARFVLIPQTGQRMFMSLDQGGHARVVTKKEWDRTNQLLSRKGLEHLHGTAGFEYDFVEMVPAPEKGDRPLPQKTGAAEFAAMKRYQEQLNATN